MAEILDPLGISVPSAPGATPNEKFDWNLFIREAFMGVNDMKVIGSTQVRNAIQYDDIQDAIDELDALGGGVIYFPAGTYTIVATLTLCDNVALVGEPGTVLTTGTDGFELADILLIDGKSDVSVRNLTLQGAADGNAACVTTGIRIRNNAARVHLESLRLFELGDCGIVVDNTTGAVPAFANRVFIRDCMIDNYNGDGIVIDQATNVDVVNCSIKRETGFTASGDPTILATKGNAIRFKPARGAEMGDVRIINTQSVTPRRNHFYQVAQEAADIAPYMLQIVGNSFEGGGTDDADTRDPANFNLRGSGIWMESTSKGTSGHRIIKGNTMRDILCYGIKCAGGQMNTEIADNDIEVPYWSLEYSGTTYTTRLVEFNSAASREPKNLRIVNNRFYTDQAAYDTYVDPTIELTSADRSVITDNVIVNSNIGILLHTSSNCSISDNSFEYGNVSLHIGVKLADGCYYNHIIGNTASADIVVVSETGTANYNIIVGHARRIGSVGTHTYCAYNRMAAATDLLVKTDDFKVQKDGWINLARRTARLSYVPKQFEVMTGGVAPTFTTDTPAGSWVGVELPVIRFTSTTSRAAVILVNLPKLVTGSALIVRVRFGANTTHATNEDSMTVKVNSLAAGGEFSAAHTFSVSSKAMKIRDFVVGSEYLTSYDPHRISIERTSGVESWNIYSVELIYREQMNGEDTN